MRPTMILPSTALFGSSFGGLFLKTLSNSNASLLLILVLAFVVTYSIGYLFMRRSDMIDVEVPECERTAAPPSSSNTEETKPLLEESERASSSESETTHEENDYE
ncbi:uncharacterized protein LOC135393860 [Ornithodoros turicata]|uniref:uncharacterized protein LOC135393860 n=1 Tax=Ornithodoros turicata TaxID=34597 RepID=UPI0031392AE6